MNDEMLRNLNRLGERAEVDPARVSDYKHSLSAQARRIRIIELPEGSEEEGSYRDFSPVCLAEELYKSLSGRTPHPTLARAELKLRIKEHRVTGRRMQLLAYPHGSERPSAILEVALNDTNVTGLGIVRLSGTMDFHDPIRPYSPEFYDIEGMLDMFGVPALHPETAGV